jgi:DME family drug/metabolite transporter
VSRRSSGVVAVLVTAALWGTTGTAAALAPTVGPWAIGAAAMGVGGLLQSLIALRPLHRSRRRLRGDARMVGLGAISVAIYPLTFYTSMRLGGVAVGTVVSLASAPLASAVLERLVDRTALSRRWTLAVGLAVAGSAVLCLSRSGEPLASPLATTWSVLLGLVAGVTYAVYSWVVHRLLGRGVERAAAMGAVFGLGGALLVPVLLATGAPLLASPRSFAVAAYMALVPMFLGYLLFGVGLTRVRPSTATTLTLAEPAVAALLAVVVVQQRMSAVGWVGLAVIALALVVLTVSVPFPRRLAAAPANEGRRR